MSNGGQRKFCSRQLERNRTSLTNSFLLYSSMVDLCILSQLTSSLILLHSSLMYSCSQLPIRRCRQILCSSFLSLISVDSETMSSDENVNSTNDDIFNSDTSEYIYSMNETPTFRSIYQARQWNCSKPLLSYLHVHHIYTFLPIVSFSVWNIVE